MGGVIDVHDTKALGSDVPDAWLGQPVTVGIRPEGIWAAGPGEAGFDADVEVVEPVGSDVFANLRLGTQALVARFGPETHPAVGSRMRLVVQPQALHVFDRESGLRRALPA